MPTRREALRALVAATAVLATVRPAAAHATALSTVTTQTMEAFADTVVPGRKRGPGDRAIAGADSVPGAVEAGALTLFAMPQLGIAELMAGFAVDLNAHAVSYAVRNLLLLDPTVPPFVALSFAHRTTLLRQLCLPPGLDQQIWIVLVFLVHLAFNSAGHLHTAAGPARDTAGQIFSWHGDSSFADRVLVAIGHCSGPVGPIGPRARWHGMEQFPHWHDVERCEGRQRERSPPCHLLPADIVSPPTTT